MLSALAVIAAGLLPQDSRADLQDEIQVYDDAINTPGERGLELHLNTTPRGRRVPAYPGEVVPHHGTRITPEFSYGLTSTLEAGLYLPVSVSPAGRFDLAGLKLRLKWLPLQTVDGVGSFAGINAELSRVGRRYSEVRTGLELRTIVGWRNRDWLVAANPILDFGLSDGASSRPELNLGVRVGRRVGEGLVAGLEVYTARGELGRTLPWQQQDNRVFLTLDVENAPWPFSIGIGRGLTDAADRWTVKAIVDVPFGSSR